MGLGGGRGELRGGVSHNAWVANRLCPRRRRGGGRFVEATIHQRSNALLVQGPNGTSRKIDFLQDRLEGMELGSSGAPIASEQGPIGAGFSIRILGPSRATTGDGPAVQFLATTSAGGGCSPLV